jgi:hypothetical protein
LLKYYNDSPSLLLSSIFPEHQLLPWKFEKSPKYWSKLENQKKFINWAAEQLNIKEPSDWYKITQKVRNFQENYLHYKDIDDIGGKSLLSNYYRGSPALLVTSIFPEYQLLPWKFDICPKNFWNKMENQREFMNWAAQQLNIKEPSDWYKVSQKVRKF